MVFWYDYERQARRIIEPVMATKNKIFKISQIIALPLHGIPFFVLIGAFYIPVLGLHGAVQDPEEQIPRQPYPGEGYKP